MIHQLPVPGHPRYTIPMWEKPSSAWVFNSKGRTHNFGFKHFNVWLYTYMVFHYDLWVSFVFFAGFGFLILCFIVLQTVRLWQSSENGNYDCKHILKDHTAEVTMFWNPYWSYFSNVFFGVFHKCVFFGQWSVSLLFFAIKIIQEWLFSVLTNWNQLHLLFSGSVKKICPSFLEGGSMLIRSTSPSVRAWMFTSTVSQNIVLCHLYLRAWDTQ